MTTPPRSGLRPLAAPPAPALDIAGAASLTPGLGGIIYALIEPPMHGWTPLHLNDTMAADGDITAAAATVRTIVVTAREDLQIAREARSLLTTRPSC